MAKSSRQNAVCVLFVLAFGACEDVPDLGPRDQPSGGETIDTAPIVRGNPKPVADAGTQNPGAIDGGQSTMLDATVVVDDGPDSAANGGAFAAAYAVFTTNCVSCHGAGKTLDLSTAELAHHQLVGVEAKYKACAGDGGLPKVRVVPGAPESSLLIEKIEGHPSCGKQMPTAMLMNPADIATVRAWVAAGAPSP